MRTNHRTDIGDGYKPHRRGGTKKKEHFENITNGEEHQPSILSSSLIAQTEMVYRGKKEKATATAEPSSNTIKEDSSANKKLQVIESDGSRSFKADYCSAARHHDMPQPQRMEETGQQTRTTLQPDQQGEASGQEPHPGAESVGGLIGATSSDDAGYSSESAESNEDIVRAELVDDPVEATEIDVEQTKEMQQLRKEFQEVNQRYSDLQRKTARRQCYFITGIVLLMIIGTATVVVLLIRDSTYRASDPLFAGPTVVPKAPTPPPPPETAPPPTMPPIAHNEMTFPPRPSTSAPTSAPTTVLTPAPTEVPPSQTPPHDAGLIAGVCISSIAFLLAIGLCVVLSRSRRRSKELLGQQNLRNGAALGLK